MNKAVWILGSILLGGLLITQVFAHGPQSGQGQGNGGHMMGSGMMGSGMGSGMMGRGMGSGMMGRGMGSGMMGRGMGSGMMGSGMGHGMMGQGDEHQHDSQYKQPQRPIDKKDAKSLLEDYLKSIGNPNLKLGTIKDVGSAFEADILTKDDSLVDKLVVDKKLGKIRSIY